LRSTKLPRKSFSITSKAAEPIKRPNSHNQPSRFTAWRKSGSNNRRALYLA
jgi:hypothetical protein